MVNWYYVVGSDRVGPVSEEMMKTLIKDGEVTGDTYVWKKGFPGWERKKDVAELQFSHIDNLMTDPEEPATEIKAEETSPEIRFTFDWDRINENEELFYVRIGKDRKNFKGTDIYGPYSLIELREALEEKRINHNTLVFTPGMSGWMKIQHTPPSAGLNGTGLSDILAMEETPLLIVLNHSPLPLVTVVKKAGTKDCSLLGAGPFSDYQGQTLLASLYVGNEIKARNIKVKIENYSTKEQLVECAFEQMDSDAKKIMLNHVV